MGWRGLLRYWLVSVPDVVVHLSFIEEVLAAKQTTELYLSLKVLLLDVRMSLTNVVRDQSDVLTNEHVRTGATLHLPEIRRHGEQIQNHELIVVMNHSFQMQIGMFQQIFSCSKLGWTSLAGKPRVGMKRIHVSDEFVFTHPEWTMLTLGGLLHPGHVVGRHVMDRWRITRGH